MQRPDEGDVQRWYGRHGDECPRSQQRDETGEVSRLFDRTERLVHRVGFGACIRLLQLALRRPLQAVVAPLEPAQMVLVCSEQRQKYLAIAVDGVA